MSHFILLVGLARVGCLPASCVPDSTAWLLCRHVQRANLGLGRCGGKTGTVVPATYWLVGLQALQPISWLFRAPEL